MYIKQQTFDDIEQLFEVLFDFEIGVPSEYIVDLIQQVEAACKANIDLQQLLATMPEEEAAEYIDDWKREKIVMQLCEDYKRFTVRNNALYGINADAETLLYSIDME